MGDRGGGMRCIYCNSGLVEYFIVEACICSAMQQLEDSQVQGRSRERCTVLSRADRVVDLK